MGLGSTETRTGTPRQECKRQQRACRKKWVCEVKEQDNLNSREDWPEQQVATAAVPVLLQQQTQ